jgi:hypothetical protein
MTNHFHLLIRERDWKISEVIKSLASSYVFYYNKKNERIGHLFQERFKSEPCNDMEYFVTLLRYIHQNRRRSESRMKLASIMPSEKEEDDSQSCQGRYCVYCSRLQVEQLETRLPAGRG